MSTLSVCRGRPHRRTAARCRAGRPGALRGQPVARTSATPLGGCTWSRRCSSSSSCWSTRWSSSGSSGASSAGCSSVPGPNRTGPFGLLQTLADGVKLALKEDLTPKNADKVVFALAPAIAGAMAFVSFAIIPMGPTVSMFGHRTPLAADRHPRRRAARARGRRCRRLRHRAGRLVLRLDLPAARWAALDRPGHLLRDRHGPVARRGVPLQRLDVDLADRRAAEGPLVHPAGVLSASSSTSSPWSARPTACPSTSPRARAS